MNSRRSFALMCLWLAACGGGGSDGGAPAPPPPAPPPPAPPPPSPPPPAPAPVPVITAPAPLADRLSGILMAEATAAGAWHVEFQLDGETIGVANNNNGAFSGSADADAYTAGQHVLRARAQGTDGSWSAWSAPRVVRFGGSRAVPSGFRKTEGWVGGLQGASAFALAPDGRIFVAEQAGALRVVKNGQLLPTPFAQLPTQAVGERGLIGVALHPDFARNGFVYVHYTSAAGGAHNRVSRLLAAGTAGDVSTGAETVLVDLPTLSSATNHNGGALHFGRDGKLYVGVGDNANGALAQNGSHPFGKLLRFNDDGSIPTDNPLCGSAGQLGCAVWAMGLRNPFTFAVHPASGRLFVNDVGQSAWEEINDARAGANFGWPQSEGPSGVAGGHVAPLFAYGHADASPPGSGPGGFFSGIAIVGGAFYPAGVSGPAAFPAAYIGDYFFADLGTRFVARLDPDSGDASAFAQLDTAPVDLRVAPDGALLVLGRGTITRIAPG